MASTNCLLFYFYKKTSFYYAEYNIVYNIQLKNNLIYKTAIKNHKNYIACVFIVIIIIIVHKIVGTIGTKVTKKKFLSYHEMLLINKQTI